MTLPHNLSIEAFLYDLPESRIAQFPLAERDHSKLLLAKPSSQTIEHHHFYDLPNLIPENALLVRNNTKVIAARLRFFKETGGKVEVLCLEPVSPPEIALALNAKKESRWMCLLGGRNLAVGARLSAQGLSATILEKNGSEALVEFSWTSPATFAELLDAKGEMPIPPYMKRDGDAGDKSRYQTVYAKKEGSVAAPTAGLHFTPSVFKRLVDKQIAIADLTLNVGMGTFKPIERENIAEHAMHTERIDIPISTVQSLIEQAKRAAPSIVAVGTTSLRTLESLYWFGARLIFNDDNGNGKAQESDEIYLSQWDSYRLTAQENLPNLIDALEAVLSWVRAKGLDSASGETELFIAPSYDFKVVNGLITNFHQPRSTLILLVAAFLGTNFWRSVYETALSNDYRFLSYGDSSLLWR